MLVNICNKSNINFLPPPPPLALEYRLTFVVNYPGKDGQRLDVQTGDAAVGMDFGDPSKES